MRVPGLDAEDEYCKKSKSINITNKNAENMLEARKDVSPETDAKWTVFFLCVHVSLSYTRRIRNTRILKK
jgi:hypothetical protein